MEKLTFIEPELIKAGDTRVRLGCWQEAPKVDVRVISEDNYQLLKQAYDKMCALAENTPTSKEQLAAPAVSKSEGIVCEAQLNAFLSWYENLSIEEATWYEGKLLQTFKSI